MIYGASAGTAATLAIGSTDDQLVVSGGAPAWAANPSITKATLTTEGDIIYASGSATPARLGIGTASQVLSVSGGVPAWTTPAGGGGMTLINTGGTSFSGSDFTISSIPTTYKTLKIVAVNFGINTTGFVQLQPNGSATLYTGKVMRANPTTPSVVDRTATVIGFNDGLDVDGNVTNGNFAVVTIDNYASASEFKQVVSNGNFSYSGGLGLCASTGELRTTTAITSLKFVTNQTFNAGTVYVYGVE
jgi:hypothetical protein